MKPIQIADKTIGEGKPALIIAEVAQAHDGSLGIAHAFIDAIASAGADVAKFQTHIAAEESTVDEQYRVHFSKQDASRYDYWKRMEFTEEEWAGLAKHAKDQGLLFMSSPFSTKAVDILERLAVPAWKIGSGEVTNFQMIEHIAKTGKAILLSAGMSSWEEQDRVVEFIRGLKVPLGLFQCTTAYPCAPEDVGLNVMEELRERYHVPVGLSDHTGTIYSGLAAASLGADMIEVHVTLSDEMFGPDVTASLTTSELKQLIEGVRFTEAMLGSLVNKDEIAREKAELRTLFFRSIVAKQDLAKGTILQNEHLTTKKPGKGIPAERLHELIGSKLARDVQGNQFLAEEDLAS